MSITILSSFPSTRLHATAVASLLIALAPIVVAADQRALANEVKTLLSAGKPNEAIRQIEKAQSSDSALKSATDVLFLQGVAWQQVATTASNADAKTQARRRTEQAYRSALQGEQGSATASGAILNNLAMLYAEMGDDTQARATFEKATASTDARRGYYTLNYARYLADRDPAKAIALANTAVNASPASKEARELLSSLLWRNDLDAMLPFAVKESRNGNTDLATRIAIRCLTTGNRAPAEKRAWLTLLAHNATASYVYADFASALATQLEVLASDVDVGRGSEQLRAVLRAPPQNRSAVEWWVQQTQVNPAVGVSGKASMRSLLRTIADARSKADPKAAEAYLQTALELGDHHGPDPEIFLRLVELYANTNGKDKLKALMDHHQYALFTEKGEAYQRNDWPLIYRMHIALGMTYAHLGIWQSGTQYQNAIFQLEAADRAAQRLNQTAERQNKPERIALPPVAIAKLSEGYAAVGRRDQSLAIKVDGASNLQKLGRLNDSSDVLESIAGDQLHSATPATKKRVEGLKGAARQVKQPSN